MREDLRTQFDIGKIGGYIRSSIGCTRLAERVVSTRVIRVNVRINNVLNWFFAQLADRGQHVVAALRQSGIHHQRALLADLNDDVSTRAC